MTSRKGCGIVALAALLATALLSGCGSSSSTAIPTTATIFYAHTVAFRNNTTLTVGYNGFGQLGNGDPKLANQTVASPVLGLGPVNLGSAGADHTLVAFTNNSTVYSWGGNYNGELGVPAIPTTGSGAFSSKPVRVRFTDSNGKSIGLNNYPLAIAAGGNHSLAVVGVKGGASGQVYAWGYNGFGQLGDGTLADKNQPTPVVSTNGTFNGIIKVAAGGSHSLALTFDNKVYAWGNNTNGQAAINPLNQLGSFIREPNTVVVDPTTQDSMKNVTQIAAGGSNSYALEDDSIDPITPTAVQKLWAWGYNGMGQIGIDPSTTTLGYQFTPNPIALTSLPGKILKIAAGVDHLLILVDDGSGVSGTVWAIGFNGFGQLGNNNALRLNTSAFVQVVGPNGQGNLTGVTDIMALGNQSFAKTGRIWLGWGDNGNGQLGNPISTTSIGYITVPTQVQGL